MISAYIFFSKIHGVLKKKKSLHFHLLSDFSIFVPKSGCKKKGFRFHLLSNFPIFFPKSRCSLRKKGLYFDFISDFSIFLPKSGCSLKKNSLFRIVLYTLNKHLQRIETVCAIFEGGPKKGGLRRLPHSLYPISTTACRQTKIK